MLIDFVRRAAAIDADLEAVATTGGSTTYGELLESAESIATALLDRSITRFAARVDDTASLVALMAGASAAGSEICVYPRCFERDAIQELLGDFDHEVLVADFDVAPDGAEVVDWAELAAEPARELPAPPSMPAMILTTGTTGRRKGALHDWSRLGAGVRRPDPEPGNRWLLAYNLHQFAGIQILIHVLASAATLTVPRTNQPREAVEDMRRLGVTHASATPTFWRFLITVLDEESAAGLPLRQITLGGEAVPDRVLADLGRLFPEARISQVYASTEFGSSVSVRDGVNGLPASVLERGDDAPVQFKIVDGQLWARSEVGMLGYYGETDPEAEGGWRPTGDQVEVRGDRIYFVGRRSEIINVGGVKVHPLPIEDAAGRVPGVKIAHAYGRPNALTGQIVVVDVVPTDDADHEELPGAVRAACAGLPAAHRPRRVNLVGEIDVRDQKIMRRTGAKA